MRIIFMGTPDFAVASLKALCDSNKHEILAVITQPDKPKGRGQKMLMTPVKEYALDEGLTVFQFPQVKSPEVISLLKELNPDIIVVAAFGQFLSKEILSLPKYGCINVHASLLPKYRGAAPIHYAIINGEKESGVTIMQMDIGMDTGDMLAKATVKIDDDMTMEKLHDELKDIGGALLLDTLDKIELQTIHPEKQNNDEATYAKLLNKEIEKIDWSKNANVVHNLIRGLNPTPGAYTNTSDGKKLKIYKSFVIMQNYESLPGTVVAIGKKSFTVACGEGALEIFEVQPESKKRMEASVFINGRGIQTDDYLC